MNKKTIALVIVFLVILVSGLVWRASQMEEGPVAESRGEMEVTTFLITAEGQSFYMDGQENPDIVVNKGDRIAIELTSEGGTHNFVIDEFDLWTGTIIQGETDTVEFFADEVGEFEYYCSIENHREEGMRGRFIVQE